jgi:hypothetical protein
MGNGRGYNKPAGDKALRDIGDYMGIKVLTPKEFLALQDFGDVLILAENIPLEIRWQLQENGLMGWIIRKVKEGRYISNFA